MNKLETFVAINNIVIDESEAFTSYFISQAVDQWVSQYGNFQDFINEYVNSAWDYMCLLN